MVVLIFSIIKEAPSNFHYSRLNGINYVLYGTLYSEGAPKENLILQLRQMTGILFSTLLLIMGPPPKGNSDHTGTVLSNKAGSLFDLFL